MAEILLSNEKFIKGVTSISDNIAGGYILPSLREAQEIKLRGILGSNLYSKLITLVGNSEIDSEVNLAYKTLLDECQYFLAYSTVTMVVEKVTYKITNFGVAKSSDENLNVATAVEVDNTKEYYQGKADYYAYLLQGYLLENRTLFPELGNNHCNKIQSNLYSAASCGIWLGGARGKGEYYNKPKCRRYR